MVLQGSESDWCPPYLKSDVLGTTVIQIILGLILELLNRQKSVSAAKKRKLFHKDGAKYCYIFFCLLFQLCSHVCTVHPQVIRLTTMFLFFPSSLIVTSESMCRQSYMRQSQQETK